MTVDKLELFSGEHYFCINCASVWPIQKIELGLIFRLMVFRRNIIKILTPFLLCILVAGCAPPTQPKAIQEPPEMVNLKRNLVEMQISLEDVKDTMRSLNAYNSEFKRQINELRVNARLCENHLNETNRPLVNLTIENATTIYNRFNFEVGTNHSFENDWPELHNKLLKLITTTLKSLPQY